MVFAVYWPKFTSNVTPDLSIITDAPLVPSKIRFLSDFLKFLDILLGVHLKHIKKIGGSGFVSSRQSRAYLRCGKGTPWSRR